MTFLRPLFAILFSLFALTQTAAAEGLFLSPANSSATFSADSVPDFLATQRARNVIIDEAYLAETIAPLGIDQRPDRLAQAPLPTTVRIELFPGIVADFRRTSLTEAFGGGFIWTGEAGNPVVATANLVIRDGQVTGHVEIGGDEPRSYRIDPIAQGGVHRITELNGGAFPSEGDPIGDGDDHSHDHGAMPNLDDLPSDYAAGDSHTVIDVLVAYTTAAASGIEASANLAISLANTGFDRSGVMIQYRLVGTVEVQNYAERDMEVMLGDLRVGSIAGFQTVHSRRDELGADLVSLLVSASGQYCGIGYLPGVPSAGTAYLGFSVTAVNCISNHTFTHELGHNAGLNHDRYVVSPTPPDSEDNYGHVNVGARFRTIMAYANRCSDAGVSCTRINNFSNPSVNYNNVPTGILINNPGAANAARWLNAVREGVAAYRPTAGGTGPINNLFVNRTTIVAPGTVTGSNVGATAEPGQPPMAVASATNTVWWRHTPSQNGQLTISTCGSSFDSVLTVFTGASLGALSQVAGNDNSCQQNASVTFSAVAGVEYQIAVSGVAGASGDISLALGFVPAASLATTTTLTAPSSGTQGDLLTFTATVSAATGTPGGIVSFRRDGTEFAQGTLSGGFATVSSTTFPIGTFQITARYLGTAGFLASTSAAQSLTVTERVVVVPPNDNFANRIVIPAPGMVIGNNVNATTEPGQPAIHNGFSTNSVWWAFTPASDGVLTINTCGSTFDTVLAVFTGNSIGGLTNVASDDDTCGFQSEVSFDAVAGTQYQIGVAGYNGVEGQISLSVALQPTQQRVSTTVLTAPAVGFLDQTVEFTANVSGAGGVPTGSVSFRSNNVEFANGALDNGTVTVWIDTLPMGTTTITAVYVGDSTFQTSTSAPRQLSIVSEPEIAAGGAHSCLRDLSRSLFCWGNNQSGEVGNSSNTDQTTPQSVPVYSRDVDLGDAHSCAVRQNGRVDCWGRNDRGQVGDGTTRSRWRPVTVPGLRRVTQVATGLNHSCALHSNGSVSCWGANDQGQLGDRTNTDRLNPVTIVGLRMVVAIAAGGNHTCALRTNGMVMCWGANDQGQLGDGTTTSRNRPASISPFGQVQQISAGQNHTCAVHRFGNVFCWGANGAGQLADGTFTNRMQAVRVLRLPAQSVTQVSAGFNHTCARATDGSAYCWGENTSGQIGDGSTTNRWRPSMVTTAAQFHQIDAGNQHTCAVTDGGVAYCWGANASGQLGNGSTVPSQGPTMVVGLGAP